MRLPNATSEMPMVRQYECQKTNIFGRLLRALYYYERNRFAMLGTTIITWRTHRNETNSEPIF